MNAAKRKHWINRLLTAGCAAIWVSAAFAQQQQSQQQTAPASAQSQQRASPLLQLQQPANSGSVTGTVLCSDTQHPARFAQVNLIPVEAATDDDGPRGFGARGSARTDLDGVFTISNVAAGDYYVNAFATGYISEAALMVASGMDKASALGRLPTVHVSANSSSTVNVSIDKGGVISGHVQWDDGSAAAGVQISLMTATPPPTAAGNPSQNMVNGGGFGGGGNNSQTDDRGQFRLSGLAPGDYLVRTVIQTPSSSPGFGGGGPGGGRTTAIVMYAPGKVRKTDAQTVTVHAGEERSDLAIVLDLHTLHRVTGHVSAVSGTVASGTVRLTDSQDSTLSRTGNINTDGSYALAYVPAGTYTLSVPYASSTVASQGRGGGRGGGSSTSGTTFQPFSETLSVTDGDLSGVDITLTPSTPSSTSP